MKTHLLFILAGLTAIAAGCQSRNGPYLPQDTTKYTLENTEKFVVMDKKVQYSVTCTGLMPRTLDDGRLEVVANIKNRENRRIQVEVSCVFKDEQGMSTGDETPWKPLILTENSTEAVKFVSMNPKARNYTIRVRQAH